MTELYNRDGIGKRTIVSSGELYGYQWYIVSYGSHPCAYVRSDIPEKVQDEIEVHGGITFSGKAFDEFTVKGKYIGWDYNHYDDYRCEDTHPYLIGGKKWTLDEIMDDVRSVIRQLLEVKCVSKHIKNECKCPNFSPRTDGEHHD